MQTFSWQSDEEAGPPEGNRREDQVSVFKVSCCHLNNALEYKPPSFKPLPPLKYLRFDPESLASLVCSMGCAWDLRISALQCSNIPAFSLRAQVGRGIVAAPWLSTFVMSECASSCTRSHTTPELAPTKV